MFTDIAAKRIRALKNASATVKDSLTDAPVSHDADTTPMPRTFEFLLNAFEAAAHDDQPADVGYAEKRRAVFQHVEDLWNDYMRLLREKQGRLIASASSAIGTTMTDLEITKLCAEAMGLNPIAINGGEVVIGITPSRYVYQPLINDAQAMALVKRFRLSVWTETVYWLVADPASEDRFRAMNTDLNRAICESVAKMQAAQYGDNRS